MTREELQKLAEDEARKRGIDTGLARAVIEKESSWNPNAVSGSGAQGLMQLMPGTAKELGVKNPFDPSENLRGGLDYLKKMQDEFKTPELSLAAYNAGPGNVRKFGGIPKFSETQNYVPAVLAKAKEYGFNPEVANVNPDQQLMKPDFQSRVQQDALGGGEAPAQEEKKQGWFGRIFGTRREDGSVDQFGNKKPGEFKEGIGRKILSFAAPLLFGAFPNPIMAALNVSLNNKRGEDFAQAGAEDRAYQDQLEQSRKLATPTDDLKKFQEWQKLTPEQQIKYKAMKESSNPYALGNLDLAQERLKFDREKERANQTEREKERELKEKMAKSKGVGNKALSADASKGLEIATGGIDEVKQFRERINTKNPSLIAPGIFDRDSALLIDDLTDRIGRLRSGGAVNAGEESRFKRLLPGPLDSKELRLKKLGLLESAFVNVAKGIRPFDNEGVEIDYLGESPGDDAPQVVSIPNMTVNKGPIPAPDLSKFAPDDQEAIQAALKEPNNPKAQAILKHFGIGG